MSNEIKRATGYLVIEVVNSNPNGDRTVKAIPVSARTAAGKFPGVLQAQTARSSGRSRYAVFPYAAGEISGEWRSVLDRREP